MSCLMSLPPMPEVSEAYPLDTTKSNIWELADKYCGMHNYSFSNAVLVSYYIYYENEINTLFKIINHSYTFQFIGNGIIEKTFNFSNFRCTNNWFDLFYLKNNERFDFKHEEVLRSRLNWHNKFKSQ